MRHCCFFNRSVKDFVPPRKILRLTLLAAAVCLLKTNRCESGAEATRPLWPPLSSLRSPKPLVRSRLSVLAKIRGIFIACPSKGIFSVVLRLLLGCEADDTEVVPPAVENVARVSALLSRFPDLSIGDFL